MPKTQTNYVEYSSCDASCVVTRLVTSDIDTTPRVCKEINKDSTSSGKDSKTLQVTSCTILYTVIAACSWYTVIGNSRPAEPAVLICV